MMQSSTSPPCYLTAIGCALGERQSLLTLTDCDSRTLQQLSDKGIEYFHASALAPWELAVRSAQVTLNDMLPMQVAAVVYATNTIRDRDDMDFAPARFLEKVGLPHVPLLGTGFNGCANLALALQVGRDRLASRQGDVLIVTTDSQHGQNRVLGSGSGVFSDGAASCWLTTQRPQNGFRLDAVILSGDARMHSVDPARDTLALLKGTADGVRGLCKRVLELLVVEATHFDWLVCGNYNRSVLQTFSGLSGVPMSRVFQGNVATVGHAHSADGLINLSDLSQGGLLSSGQHILLLSTGHSFWGAAALTVC